MDQALSQRRDSASLGWNHGNFFWGWTGHEGPGLAWSSGKLVNYSNSTSFQPWNMLKKWILAIKNSDFANEWMDVGVSEGGGWAPNVWHCQQIMYWILMYPIFREAHSGSTHCGWVSSFWWMFSAQYGWSRGSIICWQRCGRWNWWRRASGAVLDWRRSDIKRPWLHAWVWPAQVGVREASMQARRKACRASWQWRAEVGWKLGRARDCWKIRNAVLHLHTN